MPDVSTEAARLKAVETGLKEKSKPLFSFRGRVLIAAFLACFAFWVAVSWFLVSHR